MNREQMIKTAGSIIVSVGVGTLLGNVIKCTTPSSIGPLKKVCVGVGGFVLTTMISDKAVDYAEKKIEGFINQFKGMANEVQI